MTPLTHEWAAAIIPNVPCGAATIDATGVILSSFIWRETGNVVFAVATAIGDALEHALEDEVLSWTP